MPSKDDIIREASELNSEDRAMVIDTLLRTLNVPDPDIDQAWSGEAKSRLLELRLGRTSPVPADEIFSKIKERFAR